MDQSSFRGLTIACILLVVFPTGVVVCYSLFALGFTMILSFLFGPSATVSLISILASLAVGVAGGIWMSYLAWPRQR